MQWVTYSFIIMNSASVVHFETTLLLQLGSLKKSLTVHAHMCIIFTFTASKESTHGFLLTPYRQK